MKQAGTNKPTTAAGWLAGWSSVACASALGLVLTAGLGGGPNLVAADGNGNEPAPVKPDPRPVRPVEPVQPVLLPPDIQQQIQPAPMPGEPLPAAPTTPGQTPAQTPAPAPGESTQPGTTPQALNPGKLPPRPAATGILAPPPDHPTTPSHTHETPTPGQTPDEPEVHANVQATTSVKELLAKADQKLDPGNASGFNDADWKEFTTVIGGTPEGKPIADVPEEVWQDYQVGERSLRQAVWCQVFGRTDEAAQQAQEAREAYTRIQPQLKGDGVYNVVQRVAWGARIRKKYLLNDVMMVPGERILMTENLAVLNREYRLYLVFQQQDPIKQRHNRVILIGEIWRNMRDHQAPDRALAAVHKAMTALAE
ncbi:MAG TPA: hypothetical protein VL860_02080, partial [Planctomycetota bacterium]|nr:hypothetical protein [Planctomycetota bacterium]